jgi:hypothetical protein
MGKVTLPVFETRQDASFEERQIILSVNAAIQGWWNNVLKEATVVYGVDGYWNTEFQPNDTHKALLIDVEDIAQKKELSWAQK